MKLDFSRSNRVFSHIISGSTPSAIWKLLADNGFKMEARFLPRLLFSLPVVLLSMPMMVLERALYGHRIRRVKVEKPVFILGYPRSGTTYLMYLMSKDPQFAFCRMYECMGPHVMFTFGKALRFIARLVLPEKRPMDNLELGADVPKEEEFAIANMGMESMANAIYFPKRFSEYCDRFVLFKGSENEKQNFTNNMNTLFKKLTLKNRGKRLLLKSPFNTGRVRMLLEMYPDARFIHIHRHPFSVFSSNEKLYESVVPQVAFQTIDDREMEEHIFYTYTETMNKWFLDKELLAKNQLFEMSYQDFVSDPVRVLGEVYSQLELGDFDRALPHLESEVKNYANYIPNKHHDDPDKRQRVFERWKFAYDRLGYEP